ncbi:sulfite exporter TauE/SafE family protein [Francisella noatunensis]|uniref:Probable membrane transporter protein n=5 Tax=Francisella noatunensis TaxID=657445 RepID=A0A9Q2KVE9_9GAMM|nr:sulfite exporter TauE/SafE family protein [Francisella noatunensis]MBK2048700.1 sulfite exporter TauE/SafE family protein [Francisella noatunensis]MBK2051890.1 sulfite exporter TauE/SafE family protein [Francisella noatunensis]MBK2054605.1 sulfite exporter TauE/SafE family protein [Francisella noatunensis]MBK2056421.1 sulfite exporter TauE/SafE family protein [Francisella noatunensis]MBK2059308.1 sulfite exporter TauE/SafE family protein [Francisella noatunensis]
MEKYFFFELVIFMVAILGGGIGAIIGIGGALLITPLLSTLLDVPIHYAIGASLVAIICTSTATSLVSLKSHGLTKEKLGLFLALATAIGAIFGAKLALTLKSQALFLIFGGILFVVAVLSFIKKKQNSSIQESTKVSVIAEKLQLNDSMTVNKVKQQYSVKHPILGFIFMSGAGFIGGLLGIGAGIFKVIAMDKVMKIPFKVSASTSNFIMGITAFAATSTYYFAGYIDSSITAPVALGTLLGATICSKIMPYISTKVLRLTFFIVLFISALQMIIKGLI